jgi:hypothetical protein
MNDVVHTISNFPNGQRILNLNMLERGLYITILLTPDIDFAQLYSEYGVTSSLNAINALIEDGYFRAETGSKPVRYTRVTDQPDKMLEECLRVYQEVRDPAWVSHHRMTRTLEKALKSFIKQAGRDAPDLLRIGLEGQKNDWARGKKLDLVNLLSNDKVLRYADRRQTTVATTEGMVYRLSVSKPDPRLPPASSYAMRVDARQNGSVEGYVFPEGHPQRGVSTTLPARALSTPLRDWSAYQEQYA